MAKIKDYFWDQITKDEYEKWLDSQEPISEEDLIKMGGENVKQDSDKSGCTERTD